MTRMRSTSILGCLSLVFALASGCKDAGPPPNNPPNLEVNPSGETPVVVAPPDQPVPVEDAEGGAQPGADPNAIVECTPDKRTGGMCTREYAPVCGTLKDDSTKTFGNKCVACNEDGVRSYVVGACPGDEPSE